MLPENLHSQEKLKKIELLFPIYSVPLKKIILDYFYSKKCTVKFRYFDESSFRINDHNFLTLNVHF